MEQSVALERVVIRLAREKVLALEWSHTDLPDTCPGCGMHKSQRQHRGDCLVQQAKIVLSLLDTPALLLTS